MGNLFTWLLTEKMQTDLSNQNYLSHFSLTVFFCISLLPYCMWVISAQQFPVCSSRDMICYPHTCKYMENYPSPPFLYKSSILYVLFLTLLFPFYVTPFLYLKRFSFSFRATLYSMRELYHNYLISTLLNGYLGCFLSFAITNKATVKYYVTFLTWKYICNFLEVQRIWDLKFW